ncbi:dTMP kinase [Oceanibaculum indicum]|uniref:Thymidylate kinase n=1 Tax=Oceanibaculum indicum P24 TaxID=1207063 RepID=K2J764_9PROT|nr:dTMP kinase [Oceanibaculum indicum]EKE70928.1 thymidylate kinase [Oceanibaculum indicum P24]
MSGNSGTPRGRFITLEGGEGAGKSTQIGRLADWLSSRGIAVETTREPGGAPGAEAIRELIVKGSIERWDAMAEALLMTAARRMHVVQRIHPALEAGRWVICDRFSDSTMAYQGYAHGLGREPVDQLQRIAIGGLKPDLTLILDLPVEAGLARAHARGTQTPGTGEDRFERMGHDFHRRLRDGFLDIARREPERCAVIDATADIDAVADAIRDAVASRFELEKS